MAFICFLIAALTARAAIDYYKTVAFVGKMIAWLIPVVNILCIALAALGAFAAVVKLVKVIRGDGGLVEIGFAFLVSLACAIVVGVFLCEHASVRSYLLYYILTTVITGALFVVAAIAAIAQARKRKA